MSKAKIIDKRSEDNIISEKNILSRINHPFIVNMHFSFQDNDNLYLIMDYLSGGDLRYHLSHRKASLFNESQTKFFLSNIIIALEYIHSKKIIHRDIKPENLLLDSNGYLRLTDFGIAVYNKKENKKESNGTAGYVAPEVILQQEYNYSSDFFALGVIGYEFMQGNRPYYTGDRKQIKDLILVYQPKIKTNQMKKGWSENSRDFINKLLQRKPIKRLGYGGIRELKNHIWMKDINWDLLKNKKIKSPFIPKEGKEYFDKKYCENEKTYDNNKLINVKGYQHVFKNYTFINLEYVSKFIENKDNNKKELAEKEINKKTKLSLYEAKMRIHYPFYKNKSSSLLRITKNNNKKNKKEEKVKEENTKSKKDIKKENKENYSSLNNHNILYNSNNNLRRFYDLGIPNQSKEKKIDKNNSIKNNSCQLPNKNEKQQKKNLVSKEIKKFMGIKLLNKFSKKLYLNKSKTDKFIFNKTLNNENEQHVYSITKKTTKEKTTNILTENHKRDEIKKSNNGINNKISVNNYEAKRLDKNTIKKNNNIKNSKKAFSKSQILINVKEKSESLIPSLKTKDNKIDKHSIKINKKNYNTRNTMNSANKKYILNSIQNNHLKSVSNITKGKQKNNMYNKKLEKSFNSNKQKVSKKILNNQKEKKPLIKDYIKTKKKILSPDTHKIRKLKFDDYFKNTGLMKDSTKNNFYILDKFKSI